MSDAMLQKTIDLVSSMEAKNETQQLAKYELIEYTERLHEENQKYKEVINKAKEYISKHTQHDENGYVVECLYVEEAKELLEILDNKGE